MRNLVRITGAVVAVVALAVFAVACGSSNKSSSSSSSSTSSSTTASSGSSGTVVKALFGTFPDYLDPSIGYTTQSAEATWITYTPLYTYAHKNGAAGGEVIPGLATAFPKITDGGKTYTMTLRKGLTYSDGTPVKASDFTFGLERAIKLNWGGKSFYTGNIAGAADFDSGKAKTISGITTDNSTGKITIHLVQPYGAFINVLAFPSTAILPPNTPMKNESNSPPPGVGPYMIKNVVPNQGWTMVPNPKWASFHIPGIPAAKDTVQVSVAANTNSEAESVLNNSADYFDWADQLPPALSEQASQQKSRYKLIPTASTYYFFLNTQEKPFNSQLVREAVNYAIDRRTLSKLNSGDFNPTCYFLPPGIVGHPTTPCPYGNPNAAPNLAKAKALIKQSGDEGAKVTVYGQLRQPRTQFISYYTSVLNSIGLKATTKNIADAQYFPTIGNLKLNPQTGFADWNQDFPNPSDFYLLMDAKSIQPTNNQNFSQVNDPKIQSALKKLNPVPASELDSVAGQWTALDTYLAKKAYIAAFGNQLVPLFMSTHMNFPTVVFNPLYGADWTSFDKQ